MFSSTLQTSSLIFFFLTTLSSEDVSITAKSQLNP